MIFPVPSAGGVPDSVPSAGHFKQARMGHFWQAPKADHSDGVRSPRQGRLRPSL